MSCHIGVHFRPQEEVVFERYVDISLIQFIDYQDTQEHSSVDSMMGFGW